MAKPITLRQHTFDQWRQNTNTISDSVGDIVHKSANFSMSVAEAAHTYVLDHVGFSETVSTTTGNSSFTVTTNKGRVRKGMLLVGSALTPNISTTVVSVDYSTGLVTIDHPLISTGSSQISFVVTLASISEDMELRKVDRGGDDFITGSFTIRQNLTVDNNSSFGNSVGDTHVFTGLLAVNQTVSGSEVLQVTGNTKLTGALEVTGVGTFQNDVVINGGQLTIGDSGSSVAELISSEATFNLVDTTATTVNFAGAATSLTIGSTSGTATIRNATTIISGDLSVNGGDLVSSQLTFNLLNTTTTSINFAGASTGLSIGSVATITSVNGTTDSSSSITGSLTVAGGLGVAKKLYVGTDLNVTGTSTLSGAVITTGIGPTALQQHTIPAVTSDTFVLLAAAQNITNKTLGSGTTYNGNIISMTYGGTGANLTASNGGIVYTDADSMEVLAGVAVAGRVLRSGANSAPSWSTATYPATTSSGRILYSSSTNTVGEISLGTANQVLGMNNAGTTYEHKTITNGIGISITHGVGTITIASDGTIPDGSSTNTTFRVGQNLLVGSWNGTSHNAVISTNALEVRPGSGVSITNLLNLTSDNAGSNSVFSVSLSGNTSVAGTLGVTGNVSLTANLVVGGSVSLGNSPSDIHNVNTEASVVTGTLTTTSVTSGQVIMSLSSTTFRSVKYVIQSTDTTNSRFNCTEVIVTHNGTVVSMVEYGTVVIGASCGTFDADVSAGNLRLLVTPSSTSSTTFKVFAYAIKA